MDFTTGKVYQLKEERHWWNLDKEDIPKLPTIKEETSCFNFTKELYNFANTNDLLKQNENFENTLDVYFDKGQKFIKVENKDYDLQLDRWQRFLIHGTNIPVVFSEDWQSFEEYLEEA